MRITVERYRLNGACTQRCEALEPVRAKPRMRYCGLCQSAVHLVGHEAEMLELARMRKCVTVRRERASRRARARSRGLTGARNTRHSRRNFWLLMCANVQTEARLARHARATGRDALPKSDTTGA